MWVSNWLLTKSECSTRSFYSGEPHTNWESCMTDQKNAWPCLECLRHWAIKSTLVWPGGDGLLRPSIQSLTAHLVQMLGRPAQRWVNCGYLTDFSPTQNTAQSHLIAGSHAQIETCSWSKKKKKCLVPLAFFDWGASGAKQSTHLEGEWCVSIVNKPLTTFMVRGEPLIISKWNLVIPQHLLAKYGGFNPWKNQHKQSP